MADSLGLQRFMDWSGGQITEVVDALLPTNTARLVENFDVDVIGALRVRAGVTAIGNQIADGNHCLGLYNFRDSGSGSNNRQITVFNNDADSNAITLYNASGVWTAISGGSSFTAGAKHRFATFLDYVFLVNSSFNTPVSWDGGTASNWSGTNLSSAPAGQFITTFKSRVYIAGTSANPDRLFFSSIPSTAATPIISWDTTNDWIDINPADGREGGDITGLANNGTLLLIFKERALYRWNGSATDANLVVNVGCTSQESISTRNGLTFFFNPAGVYVTDGGFPTKLSLPIQRWIDAIPGTYYSEVSGFADENHYYCSIGDVTVDDVAYSNVVLVYTVSSKTWVVRTYAEEIRRFAAFVDSDETEKIMVGNDDGDIQDFNVGSTDAGTSIKYHLITKQLDFGTRAYFKTFSDAFAFGEQLPGAETRIQTEDKPAKSITEKLVGWWRRMFGMKNRGRYFVFELVGYAKDGQGYFFGWEILDVGLDGLNE